MGSASWRKKAVPRYEGEVVSQHSPVLPCILPPVAPLGLSPYLPSVPPKLKDLKRQLHLERKRADKLQERLQDILTNSKSRSGEGPRPQGRLRPREAGLGPERQSCFLYLTPPALLCLLSLLNLICLFPFLCVCLFPLFLFFSALSLSVSPFCCVSPVSVFLSARSCHLSVSAFLSLLFSLVLSFLLLPFFLFSLSLYLSLYLSLFCLFLCLPLSVTPQPPCAHSCTSPSVSKCLLSILSSINMD